MTTPILSSQLQYKSVEKANCKYKFQKIPLNQPTGTLTVTPTVGPLLEWKLGNSVYNLSQSYIGFTETVVAPAASRFTWMQEDTLGGVSNIFFGNALNADLCNLSFANKYLKIARKIATNLPDFLTNDDETSLLYPSDSLANVNYYPVVDQGAGGYGVKNYTEPKYLSKAATTGPPITHVRNRLFRLGDIPDSIFSVDKDIYIPVDMYLRLTMTGNNTYVWSSLSTTDPASTPLASAVNSTLTNCYLYLAIETNDQIAKSVISSVHSGQLVMNVPYTIGFRNTSSSTSGNINLSFNKQNGKKLKQVLTTVFNATETNNTSGDCGNYNGTKIKSYVSYLNNNQLQNNPIQCDGQTPVNINDWIENSRHCEGSVIQSRLMYAQNWFALDKFLEDSKGSDVPDENRQDGYDLTVGGATYQFTTTTTGDMVYYQFASFSRDVQFNPSTGYTVL